MEISSILQLPVELINHILTFLNNRDFGTTQRSCKGFHVVSKVQLLKRMELDYKRCCFDQGAGFLYHASHNGWILVGEHVLEQGHLLQVFSTDHREEIEMTGWDCLAGAYSNKQFKMIDWLIDHEYEPSHCMINRAILNSDLKVYDRVSALKTRFKNIQEFALDTAIGTGYVAMVQHLISRGFTLEKRVYHMIKACSSGSIEMVEFLETCWHQTFFEVATELGKKSKHDVVMNSAVESGNLKLVLKLVAQGFPIDPASFDTALFNANFEIMDWFMEQKYILPTIYLGDIRDHLILPPWRRTDADKVKANRMANWLTTHIPYIDYYGTIMPTRDAIKKLQEENTDMSTYMCIDESLTCQN